MEISKSGQWIQAVANLGILAGLILVGVQIAQNTKAIEAQMWADANNSQAQFELTMMGENPAEVWERSIETPADLTLAEHRVMDAYIYMHLVRWRHSYYSGMRGYVPEDQWRRFAGDAPYVLANSYGRAWWKRFKEDASEVGLPPDLASFIEQRLGEQPDETQEYFARIQEELKH